MTPKEKLAWAIADIEKSTNFDILAEMKTMMNSVYGSDRNQIIKPSVEGIINAWGRNTDYMMNVIDKGSKEAARDQIKEAGCYSSIIHFPEIIIQNEYSSHTITDIYVKFIIRPSGTIKGDLWGARTTLTDKEYKSRYQHSHLHCLDPNHIGFSYFCTGTGEINQVMAILNNKYSAPNFMMFLMHIKNFLEWESVEGTPYMFMSDIGKDISSRNMRDIVSSACDKFAEYLATSIINKLDNEELIRMLQFTVTETNILVKHTHEMEVWLASEILTFREVYPLLASYLNDVIVSKDSTGRYCAINRSTGTDGYPDAVVLEFKGKQIKLQIIDKVEEKAYEKVLHPKITEGVCKELSHIFTKTALTTPGIRSGSAINDKF